MCMRAYIHMGCMLQEERENASVCVCVCVHMVLFRDAKEAIAQAAQQGRRLLIVLCGVSPLSCGVHKHLLGDTCLSVSVSAYLFPGLCVCPCGSGSWCTHTPLDTHVCFWMSPCLCLCMCVCVCVFTCVSVSVCAGSDARSETFRQQVSDLRSEDLDEVRAAESCCGYIEDPRMYTCMHTQMKISDC